MDESIIRLPLLSRTGIVREYAIIDLSDRQWLSQWTWRLIRCGKLCYAGRREKAKVILLHREIMGLPRQTDERVVDHLNGRGLDNRKSNLRILTNAQNLQNRQSVQVSSSTYRGVSWHASSRRWQASAKLDGKSHFLGYFTNELEAARVAAKWRSAHMPYAVETVVPQPRNSVIVRRFRARVKQARILSASR